MFHLFDIYCKNLKIETPILKACDNITVSAALLFESSSPVSAFCNYLMPKYKP
jgi:hypothetical protein